MRLILLALLMFMPFASHAQEAPVVDEDVTALADMSTRYTIGPWEGYTLGKTCLLTNAEPLSFATLELSQGIRISPLAGGETSGFNILIDGVDKGKITQPLTSELLLAMEKGSFLSIGPYRYDLHGFSKAAALFQKCRDCHLPTELPAQPIEEGDSVSVPGAEGWEIISLMFDGYAYARYAMMDGSALGLWVHNGDEYVLSLTLPPNITSAAPYQLTLNGKNLTYVPQPDSLLLPLSQESLKDIEAAGQVSLKVAGFEKTFQLKGFHAVVMALQSGK